MELLITDTVEALGQAYEQAGWWGVLAVSLMVVVNVYRLEVVQMAVVKLNPKAGWAAWPQWVKLLVPFALSFVGALILKVVGGLGWGAAIAGAIGTALTAIGGHHAIKTIGQADTRKKLAKDPDYKASAAKSIILGVGRIVGSHGLPPPGDPDEKEPKY
jgi:hypothetical protein